ncbi:hypothetical protein CY34DRAFT_802380 [Suillus luteus UH-Slu-Lm8-n1]|uniref:Uncharacterized protein n=1 Tax=Suillus luteus UH-Slu-Lm8-n1 TaxID=930992 RepID=A0A0D0BN97_9AGAM|nr:hypothetical protein CY34DRAFT_802380 [Suillus luteus UH-Slu-Lm8-n1]
MSWHGSLELQERSRILSESARPPGRFLRKKLANITNLQSCCHVDPIQAQLVVLVIVGPSDALAGFYYAYISRHRDRRGVRLTTFRSSLLSSTTQPEADTSGMIPSRGYG